MPLVAGSSRRNVESTRLVVLAVSLGSVETLVEHPASMSHSLLSDEELRRAGIPPRLIRLSVGIEYPDDLNADLQQALATCGNGVIIQAQPSAVSSVEP